MQSKKKGYGESCAAINCTNSRSKNPGLSFYRFPKDPERCRKWVLNVRRSDLMKKDSLSLHNFCLCAHHFDGRQFMNAQQSARLVHDAIPTLFKFYRSSDTDKMPSTRKPMLSRTCAAYREEYGRLFGTTVKKSKKTSATQNNNEVNNFVTKDKRCSVRGCPNQIAVAPCERSTMATLYEFPTHPEIRSMWLEFCQIPDSSHPKYVCSLHFVSHDYVANPIVGLRGRKRPELKTCAVPSRRLVLQLVQNMQGSYSTRWAIPETEYNGQVQREHSLISDLENNSSTNMNSSGNLNLSLENESLRSQLVRSESLLAKYMAKCEKLEKALKGLQEECARLKQANNTKDGGDEVEKDLFMETSSTYVANTSEATDEFLVTDVYTIEEIL